MGSLKVAIGSFVLIAVAQCHAITITTTFVPEGGDFGFGLGAAASAGDMQGGGDLTSVFRAAADIWQNAIGDAFTLNLTFGWQDMGSSALGIHALFTQGGTPNRELTGNIRFNNRFGWFADGTPLLNEEYTTFTPTSQDLGGGLMNTGRVYTGATGAALGRYDMLTVMLHEMGHSLGLASGNTAFQTGNGDRDVDITGPRPFAGAQIPTLASGSAHLTLPSTLMYASVGASIRRLPTDADIVANMEISQFTQFGAPVPEPATLAAFAFGAVALMRKRRKR